MSSDAKKRAVIKYQYEMSLLQLDLLNLLKHRESIVTDIFLQQKHPKAYEYYNAMNKLKISHLENKIAEYKLEIDYIEDSS